MEYLRELNTQQQQAVTAGMGPVLVLAGPGSGKTRVLTQRIAYLIGHMGVSPYNILAVTFTNKAAREMENRVVDLLDKQTRGLTLGTFHATCARFLRQEAEYLPFNAQFVIYDDDDQISLVKRALMELNIDEKLYRPQSVHASISNAKNELTLPDDYPVQTYRDEVVRRVYQRYQELLLANNGLDFDDLLFWAVFLMDESPTVREKYARRFEHVLVDEFQDTNQAQYALLKHLSSFHNNIFVVGDADQSIYRWRGADYRNVLRFESDYPDTQVILLEHNYRSTQTILDVAMAIIDRNPSRKPKHLFTQRGEGEKIVLYEAFDDRQEATYVVDSIAHLVASNNVQPGDFAVMYRTNAQSRLLEESFLHANLPYKLVGAQRFYGRREVKDVIAFLRLIHNPGDEISMLRVINVPPRGIGNKTLVSLRTYAQNERKAPGEILLELGRSSAAQHSNVFSGRAASALSNFGRLLARWYARRENLTPLELMDEVLRDINYHDHIDDATEEGQDRWENILELRRLAAEHKENGLAGFLEAVALVTDQDTLDESANVPTLLTLHAAKGLEFPIVFIIGLNDGTLPHMRSFEDPEAMEEERRLFYVGITRAKNRLYFTIPMNRNAYGYSEPVIESRFLADIPVRLFSRAGMLGVSRRRPGIVDRSNKWDTATTRVPGLLQPQYQPGARVIHPVWGEGMVLNSRIQDDDEIVDIFFEELGLKRVAASLARLELMQ